MAASLRSPTPPSRPARLYANACLFGNGVPAARTERACDGPAFDSIGVRTSRPKPAADQPFHLLRERLMFMKVEIPIIVDASGSVTSPAIVEVT